MNCPLFGGFFHAVNLNLSRNNHEKNVPVCTKMNYFQSDTNLSSDNPKDVRTLSILCPYLNCRTVVDVLLEFHFRTVVSCMLEK